MSWNEKMMLDGDKTSLQVPGGVRSETDVPEREGCRRRRFFFGKREKKSQALTKSLLQPPALIPRAHCLCKPPHTFSPAALTHLAPFIPFLNTELTSHPPRTSPGASLLPQTPISPSLHPEPTLLLQSLRLCLQGQETLH